MWRIENGTYVLLVSITSTGVLPGSKSAASCESDAKTGAFSFLATPLDFNTNPLLSIHMYPDTLSKLQQVLVYPALPIYSSSVLTLQWPHRWVRSPCWLGWFLETRAVRRSGCRDCLQTSCEWWYEKRFWIAIWRVRLWLDSHVLWSAPLISSANGINNITWIIKSTEGKVCTLKRFHGMIASKQEENACNFAHIFM